MRVVASDIAAALSSSWHCPTVGTALSPYVKSHGGEAHHRRGAKAAYGPDDPHPLPVVAHELSEPGPAADLNSIRVAGRAIRTSVVHLDQLGGRGHAQHRVDRNSPLVVEQRVHDGGLRRTLGSRPERRNLVALSARPCGSSGPPMAPATRSRRISARPDPCFPFLLFRLLLSA